MTTTEALVAVGHTGKPARPVTDPAGPTIVFRANGKLIAATRVAFGQDPASRDFCALLSVTGPGHAAGPADPGQRRMGHGGGE